MCFWPDQPQNWSNFLKNGDWLGRKWRGWSRYPSMIARPVVLHLSYELMYSSLSIGGTLYPYYMRTLWSHGEHCVGSRPITDQANVHDMHEELSRRNYIRKRNVIEVSDTLMTSQSTYIYSCVRSLREDFTYK